MKKLLLISALCFFISAATFVEGLEDLPLAPNWQQINDKNFSFGNEHTNFVELYVESKKESFDDLIGFYKKTLPQLGWRFDGVKNNSFNFVREKELLIIEKIEKNARITLKSSN